MTQCYVAYLIDAAQDGHRVCKIGHSSDPWRRFRDLNSMAWVGPELLEVTQSQQPHNGAEIEWYMHRVLKDYRIHHEWFHVEYDALEKAKNMASQKFGVAFDFADISDQVEAWDITAKAIREGRYV